MVLVFAYCFSLPDFYNYTIIYEVRPNFTFDWHISVILWLKNNIHYVWILIESNYNIVFQTDAMRKYLKNGLCERRK